MLLWVRQFVNTFIFIIVIFGSVLWLPMTSHARNLSCGYLFEDYEVVFSAVGVLRDEMGRVLILKRSINDRSFPGKWSLPGGKVDAGETVEQAVIREVKEEAGLDVEIIRAIGVNESLLSTRNRKYVIYSFAVQIKNKSDVQLSHEHEDYRWVFPQEARNLPLAGGVTEKLILSEQ